MRRIIVAITGATGSLYGIRILQHLANIDDIETHLVVSAAGYLTVTSETRLRRSDLEALANVVHSDKDIGASLASGSFRTSAMIVAPCSMKSLAAIATGVTGTLIARAADVILKERRRLVLLARETPLTLTHLRNMTYVTEMGGIVCPPVPAFYNAPTTLEDIVDETVGRVLTCCGVDNDLVAQWQGLSKA